MIKILLFTFLSIYFSITYGQKDTLTFPKLDAITYKLYLQKDWDNLIRYAKAGLKQNIDFYYLRIRLAEAYLAKHKERKAIIELEKALNMSDYSDKYAISLLYEAYIKTGDYLRAHYLETKLSKIDKKIDELYISSVIASNKTGVPPLQKDAGDETVSTYYIKGFKTYTTDILMYKGKRLWTISNSLIPSSVYFYGIDSENKNYYSNFTGIINDLSATKYIIASNKLTYHYDINMVYEKYKLFSTKTTESRTFIWQQTNQEFVYSNQKSISLAGSFGTLFSTPYISFASQAAISSYGTDIQFIPSQTIILYPFASPRLYLQGSFNYLLYSKNTDNEILKNYLSENPYVISGEVGFNIGKVSIFGFYYSGSIYNFYESPSIHYISPYLIFSQSGGGVNVFFNKLTLNFSILIQNGEDFIKHQTATTDIYKPYDISIKILKGGLLWKF